MTMLQSGSSELLTALQFDEAREILEQRAKDLVVYGESRRPRAQAEVRQPGSRAALACVRVTRRLG